MRNCAVRCALLAAVLALTGCAGGSLVTSAGGVSPSGQAPPAAATAAPAGAAGWTQGALDGDGDGNAYTYGGGAWATHPKVAPAGDLGMVNPYYHVSCASASFCAAVGGNGSAQVFAGGNWTASVTIDTTLAKGAGYASVSCPATGFCMAVDTTGATHVFDGTAWKVGAPVNGEAFNGPVSCASSSFCLTMDAGGDPFVYTGTSWSLDEAFRYSGTGENVSAVGVSCPSATFCVAAGAGGYAIWR
jgi:hypothetical protein